jgi:hypothetical protein
MGQEMADVPRHPPPKKEVALALLEESSMFIHLDPRRPDVLVPKGFMGQPQLVLQVGLNMAIPIPDLKIDDAGISCTLSFNRTPFWCRIPWSAVYALVGEDGRGGVWADDVPPEIQQQRHAPPKAAPKKGRPGLTAVGSSRDEAKPTPSRSRPPSRRGAAAAVSDDDGIVENEPVRPQLTAVPAGSGQLTASGSRGELSAVPPEASSAPPPAEEDDGQGPRPSQPAGGKKPKREIPPYLRVIK